MAVTVIVSESFVLIGDIIQGHDTGNYYSLIKKYIFIITKVILFLI